MKGGQIDPDHLWMSVVCELAVPKHHMMAGQEIPPLESKNVPQFNHDEDLGLICGRTIIYIVGIKKKNPIQDTLSSMDQKWLQIAVRAVEWDNQTFSSKKKC